MGLSGVSPGFLHAVVPWRVLTGTELVRFKLYRASKTLRGLASLANGTCFLYPLE